MNRVLLKPTTPVPHNSVPQFLRKRQIARLLGCDPTAIDRWRRAGKFPKPYELSEKVLVWRMTEIDAWIETRRGER